MKQLVYIAVALAGLASALWAAGYSPLAAAEALVHRSVGSASGLAATARRAVPLLLCGLGVLIAFRAGLWNIGAEGQLLAGAVAAAWAALRLGAVAPGPLGPVPALAAAALAGAAWAALPALLRVGRGVPEVISTILMNFVALELIGYAVTGPLRESQGAYPQTDLVPEAARLQPLLAGTQVHTGLLLALGAALAVHVLLFRTTFGLELRALGSAPGVAVHAGVPAGRRALAALALSGALAGLGGAVELLGVTHRLFERFSPGYGFTAIGVALLGRLHPLGIVPAAVCFGALEAGAGELQRGAGIPSVLVSVLEGLALLGALLLLRRRG
jgi:simple sugar transport system permease protein